MEEQHYELSPARPDNINTSLTLREQAIQTWMPNAPPSLFQIFDWKVDRYLTKKGFVPTLQAAKEKLGTDTNQDDWIYPGTQTAT